MNEPFKWTADGRYFGRPDQVDAYDRGEPVEWESVPGNAELVDIDPIDIGPDR